MTPVPCPALRLNIQHNYDASNGVLIPNEDNEADYEVLVVDEKGENSVKDKNNKTKTPAIGTAMFKIPKREEQSLELTHMADYGMKFEDLIRMRDNIGDFIMDEIHKRINSKVPPDDGYSHIELEPDDIIPENILKKLGHSFF